MPKEKKVWGNPEVCKEKDDEYRLKCMYKEGDSCPHIQKCYDEFMTGENLNPRPTSGRGKPDDVQERTSTGTHSRPNNTRNR